jgi:predicted nuclease with TOPRIM domain
MSRSIQEKLHRQHREWRSDCAAWRADLEAWRTELRAAQTELAEIEEVLRGSLEALEAHGDEVWEGEQRIRAHESMLSQEVTTGATRKTDKHWAALHHRQAAQHERLADTHARIRRHHRTVVAAVMRLLKRTRSAM